MGKYYIRMDGDVFGPYTAKGMMELDLTPDIMVTEESIDIWQPANKFDFFQLAKQEVLEKLKTTPVKGEVYNTGISVVDLLKMCAIPVEQQNSAYNQLLSDQNVKIVNSQVLVPNVNEIIKQAAFYRKQSSKHAKEH